jgi:hypothetical protein
MSIDVVIGDASYNDLEAKQTKTFECQLIDCKEPKSLLSNVDKPSEMIYKMSDESKVLHDIKEQKSIYDRICMWFRSIKMIFRRRRRIRDL